MSFLRSKLGRVAVGAMALSAFAVAPVAAQAADTISAGTLTAGSLSNTAPPISAFTVALTGVTATKATVVGGYSVTDATGSNAGYSITVSATAPTVDGDESGIGSGSTMTLTSRDGVADAANPASAGPHATTPQSLVDTASTIQNATAGTGQGKWDFRTDGGTEESLAIVIPGDASAGAYASTLTYTTAAPVV